MCCRNQRSDAWLAHVARRRTRCSSRRIYCSTRPARSTPHSAPCGSTVIRASMPGRRDQLSLPFQRHTSPCVPKANTAPLAEIANSVAVPLTRFQLTIWVNTCSATGAGVCASTGPKIGVSALAAASRHNHLALCTRLRQHVMPASIKKTESAPPTASARRDSTHAATMLTNRRCGIRDTACRCLTAW